MLIDIDVDGIVGYSAANDIKISQVADATATAGNNFTAGTFDLN